MFQQINHLYSILVNSSRTYVCLYIKVQTVLFVYVEMHVLLLSISTSRCLIQSYRQWHITYMHIHFTVGMNVYAASNVGKYLPSFANQLFIILLGILPYLLCVSRLVFFVKYFDGAMFCINPKIEIECTMIADMRQATGKFVKIALICEVLYYVLSMCTTLSIIGAYPDYVCCFLCLFCQSFWYLCL